MRKYLVGALAGFLLTLPFYAFGSQISTMIGKKIQTEYDVLVNGKQLSVKAVAFDGTSYSPNRAIADALGMDIKLENKTVVFTSKTPPVVADTGSTSVATPTSTTTTVTTPQGGVAVPDNSELDTINTRLGEIAKAESEYLGKSSQLMLEYNIHPEKRGEIEAQTKSLEDGIRPLLEEKKDLLKRKAELEAQATP